MQRLNFLRTRSLSLQSSILLAAALLAVLWLGACAQAPAPEPPPFSIELLPPEAGVNALSVRLTDNDGQPIADAQVSLEGNMNHAGMTPVLTEPVTDDADGAADGVYQVPFKFTMFGDWIVTVTVAVDGETVTQDFTVSVDAEGARLGGDQSATHSDMGDMEADTLMIMDVRARPVPMQSGNSAVFLSITNQGDQPERLVDATSDAADVVELHETVKDGDVMRMVHKPEGFELPPGETVALKPGGKHIMLMGVTAPMQVGDEIQVELVFEKHAPVTLTVPVVEMNTP